MERIGIQKSIRVRDRKLYFERKRPNFLTGIHGPKPVCPGPKFQNLGPDQDQQNFENLSDRFGPVGVLTMAVLGSLICEGFFSEWPTTNFMTRSREMNLISNHLWNVFMNFIKIFVKNFNLGFPRARRFFEIFNGQGFYVQIRKFFKIFVQLRSLTARESRDKRIFSNFVMIRVSTQTR